MDAVERNGFELIPHPAYSPDLAPSDFFLFPNLKKDIRGLHFRSDEEVVTAVEEWVNGKDPDFFSSGLMALEHRWSKCITLEDNYIEKEKVDLNRKEVRLVTYWLTLVTVTYIYSELKLWVIVTYNPKADSTTRPDLGKNQHSEMTSQFIIVTPTCQ